MVESNETLFPVLTVCPAYEESYNISNLNKIGIESAADYRSGNWYGNSTLGGRDIFNFVTHPLSDLIEKFVVLYESGQKFTYFGKFTNLTVTEKGHRTYGKCFEIHFGSDVKDQLVLMIDLNILKPIYIHFNLADSFWNYNSRSKLQANVGENIFLEVTYEILKNNFGNNCKTYEKDNFDTCKETAAEKLVLEEYNCTVPYKTASPYPLCSRLNKELRKTVLSLNWKGSIQKAIQMTVHL